VVSSYSPDISMPPRKCTKCGAAHAPPRGKNCPMETEDGQGSQMDKIAQTLADISHRLTKLETAPQQPSSPSVQSRHDSPAAQLSQRLLDLQAATSDSESDASGDDVDVREKNEKRKKSGKLMTAQHKVNIDIDWPHFYVYRGNNPVSYDSMTIAEFTFGYLSAMDKTDRKTSQHMHSHLRVIMEEASQFKWDVVLSYHAVVLNHIETGRLTWAQASQEDLRRRHIWNAPVVQRQAAAAEPKRCCIPFQDGRCTKQAHHDGLLHACRYCLKAVRRQYRHAEHECQRKIDISKNGHGEAE
jgi:hypothetical protein